MTSHCICGTARQSLLLILLTVAVPAGFVAPVAARPGQESPLARPPAGRSVPESDGDRLRKYVVTRSSLDRSAVWIGDRFTYTVDIGCSHGVDILTDDLSRDRLQLEGLDVLGLDQTREDRGDGITVYRFVYRLTTYRPDPAAQRIGELRVRFYVRRPGQRAEDIVPAGEVVVPGTLVAVRSLLPDARETANFRSEQPPLARTRVFTLLQPLGIGLVIVSVVPAAFWSVAALRRLRHRRPRPSARKLRHGEHASVEALKALDLQTESGRREAFDRLNALVRGHVAGAWGVPADALTGAEIESALSAAGRAESAPLAVSLLETCERARYGRSEDLPPASACEEAIVQAAQLISAGRA